MQKSTFAESISLRMLKPVLRTPAESFRSKSRKIYKYIKSSKFTGTFLPDTKKKTVFSTPAKNVLLKVPMENKI